MIKLTTAQTEAAKSWITDLFILAGMYSDLRSASYPWMHKSYEVKYDSGYKEAAITIYKEITGRKFANTDKAFEKLSTLKFGESLSSDKGIKKSPEILAKFVAWLCQSKNILWNDIIYDPEEIKDFLSSYLGKQIAEAGLLVSQKPEIPSVGKVARTSSGTSTTRVAGAPKDDYKSLGGMSGSARDLKVAPGAKETFSGLMYAIIGKSATAEAPAYAFLRPLSVKGAAGSTNKVFLGRDSGYRDCACWFNDKAEAERFLERCKAIDAPGISDLALGYKKPDRNGYFKIGTEFGDCYIKASKLNEDIKEEIKEAVDIDTLLEQDYPATDIIVDIKKFAKSINSWDD